MELEERARRFPKSARLRKRREFLAVQNRGTKVHGKHFLVVVLRGGSGRVGITVSKKVGNAVTRNRIKRLVREFSRHHDWIGADIDVVVIAKRSSAEHATYGDVCADLSRLIGRVRAC